MSAEIKAGDKVRTPRFLSVNIEKVFKKPNDSSKIQYAVAREEGYTEPTHYDDGRYDIFGKHTGFNTMVFAAIEK